MVNVHIYLLRKTKQNKRNEKQSKKPPFKTKQNPLDVHHGPNKKEL